MELHDIYPAEEIVEYSVYLFLLYFSLLLLFSYLLIKYYQKRKKRALTPLEILEISDYSRAKEMAFKLFYYGDSLVQTVEQKTKLKRLKEKLEPFKYSHCDDILSKTVQDEIQDFITSVKGQ